MNIKNLVCYKPNKPLDLEFIQSQNYENVKFLPTSNKNVLKIKLQFPSSHDWFNYIILSLTSTGIMLLPISNKNVEPLSKVIKETFNIESLTYDILMYSTSYKASEEFVTKYKLYDCQFMKEQLQLDFNMTYDDILHIDSKSLESLEKVYQYIEQLYENDQLLNTEVF